MKKTLEPLFAQNQTQAWLYEHQIKGREEATKFMLEMLKNLCFRIAGATAGYLALLACALEHC